MADIYDDQFKNRVAIHILVCDPASAGIIFDLRKYLEREREARKRAEKVLREATDAIRWALGANGDFAERKVGQGGYWWRTELRERSERALASLKSSEGAK